MKHSRNIFNKYLTALCGLIVLPSLFGLGTMDAADAAVVQRGRVAASRATSARKPVATTTKTETVAETPQEPESESESAPEQTETPET